MNAPHASHQRPHLPHRRAAAHRPRDRRAARRAPRSGLVGRNGAGKTTLFRLIAGEIGSETGAISLPRNARIGQVAQEAPVGRGVADRDRARRRPRARRPAGRGRDGDRPAPHRRDPYAARRYRRPFGRGARGVDPRRPRLRRARRSAARASSLLRRLADARRAGRRRSSPSPTSCCSTSRPTISTSRARCGWRLPRALSAHAS